MLLALQFRSSDGEMQERPPRSCAFRQEPGGQLQEELANGMRHSRLPASRQWLERWRQSAPLQAEASRGSAHGGSPGRQALNTLGFERSVA